MLDAFLRPLIDPPLAALARPLASAGVRADLVTWAGFALGLLAALMTACAWHGFALVFILFNRLADGLDGALARQTVRTDYGGFLDITLDFVFYASIPLAFAIAYPEQRLAAAFLLASFFASGGSFLAYAVIAAKRGLETEIQGKKSFYYLGGLVEGTETVIFFALISLFPAAFGWLAWLFGALCCMAALGRILAARQNLKDLP